MEWFRADPEFALSYLQFSSSSHRNRSTSLHNIYLHSSSVHLIEVINKNIIHLRKPAILLICSSCPLSSSKMYNFRTRKHWSDWKISAQNKRHHKMNASQRSDTQTAHHRLFYSTEAYLKLFGRVKYVLSALLLSIGCVFA